MLLAEFLLSERDVATKMSCFSDEEEDSDDDDDDDDDNDDREEIGGNTGASLYFSFLIFSRIIS